MIRDLPPRVNTFSSRHADTIAWVLLSLELIGKFALCMVAIFGGVSIALHTTNDGVAILAALGCALVISWAFGKERA